MKRTQETESAYLRRAGQLLKRFTRETGRKWEDEPLYVAEWLRAKAPGLRKSTFRIYRASLAYFMKEKGPFEAHMCIRSLPETIAAINIGANRTSSSKLKRVPMDIFHAIIVELENSRSDYADLLVNFIYCNSIVGLRPIEWNTLSVSGSSISCCNAKHSFGRGRAGKRTIDLSGFDPSLLGAFSESVQQINFLKEQGVSFNQIYAACRQLLHRAQQKLFPNMKQRLTLYSTRHQSVGNMKYAGASREELAVMFGHSSLKTARQHYAGRRTGRAMASLPVASDVEMPEMLPIVEK